MRWPMWWMLIGCVAGVCADESRGDSPSVDQVKSLFRSYVEGFVSPVTELAYGRRINGPAGVAALESPTEIAQGRVGGMHRPYGYGSGIEDLAYHNGMLLFALCDAEEATKDAFFADMAHRTFRGLQRMSTISRVPGFVPRGPHPDGKSYYADSSVDQHTLYVCGLWRMYRSRIATPEEKASIRVVVGNVIRRLEKANWAILVEDGNSPAWAGGSLLHHDGQMPLSLLMMLAAAHDVTGNEHWKKEYERVGSEGEGKRWNSLVRPVDRSRPRRYTMFQNQAILRGETLRRIESSAERRAILRGRIADTAHDMLSCAYFQAWRSLDWLGEESWEAAGTRDVANAYLEPLGVSFDSGATVMDLWRKFDLNRLSPPTLRGRRNHYEPITLATPAMVWQIALLSQEPDLISQSQKGVREMLGCVEFSKIHMGWACNYALLAALWSLEPTQKP